MKPLTGFRYFCLTRFSKPAFNREIYKLIRQSLPKSILELGLGDGTRAETMIQVAQKFLPGEAIRYSGIDMFEGRENGEPKLPFKDMHRRINALGAKAQLAPGTPDMAVPRIANSHPNTDWVVISGSCSEEEMAACWFYFPRMLHAQSTVLIQPELEAPFERLSRVEIEKRAEQAKSAVSRAAA